MPGVGKLRPARSFYAARRQLQKYKPCSLFLIVEMAWAAKRPANEPLPTFEIPFNFHFSEIWLNVHKKMDLLRVRLCFWDEVSGSLPLLGKRFRAMGGPCSKKVSPCHLYDSTLLILSGILGHLRTFERKLGHPRT